MTRSRARRGRPESPHRRRETSVRLLFVVAACAAACGAPERTAPGPLSVHAESASAAPGVASDEQTGGAAAVESDPPVVDLEVRVAPTLTREDLLARAAELLEGTRGCPGHADLEAAVDALRVDDVASSSAQALWHRYGLVVVTAERVRRSCE